MYYIYAHWLKGSQTKASPLCLLLLLLGATTGCWGQEKRLHITELKEVYHVAADGKGYDGDVSVVSNSHNKKEHLINIYFGELEHINEISADYNDANGKKHKIAGREIVQQSILTGNFFTGIIAHSFNLPEGTTGFNYGYHIHGDNLMLLTSVVLNSEDTISRFDCEIMVPDGYTLIYRVVGDTTTLSKWELKQELTTDGKLTKIFSEPKAPMKRGAEAMYQLPKSITPMVQLIVVPNAYVNRPFAYFNWWYQQLLKPRNVLDAETKKIADKEFLHLPFDSQPRAIFSYVKKSIHYIDIENGLGAFQPRDINYVCHSNMGDCKDMANLLCGLLQYTGHKACMAISSTISHGVDLDFPSLSSANHAICVLHDKENIYLDATESHCLFGFPSRHIQGRNIFMIEGDEGQLQRVPIVASAQNKTELHIELALKDGVFKGKMDGLYTGLGSYFLQNAINYSFQSATKNNLEKWLSKQSRNLSVTNLEWKSLHGDSAIQLTSELSAERCLNHVGNQNYITGGFQPWPSHLPQTWDSLNNLATYNTIDQEVSIDITLPEKIKLVASTPVFFNKNGLTFTYQTSQINANTIHVAYRCVVEQMIIGGEILNDYAAMNSLMLQTLNKAIIYENL